MKNNKQPTKKQPTSKKSTNKQKQQPTCQPTGKKKKKKKYLPCEPVELTTLVGAENQVDGFRILVEQMRKPILMGLVNKLPNNHPN